MKTKPIKAFTVMTTQENIELLHSMTTRKLNSEEVDRPFIVARITNYDPMPLDLKPSNKAQGVVLNTDALSALVLMPIELWSNFIKSI